MKNIFTPKFDFEICKIAGFGLLFAFWVASGKTTGFFLLLFLVVMSLLRWRLPKLGATVFIDFVVCAVLNATGDVPGIFLTIPAFEAMYLGFYWSALGLGYIVYNFGPADITAYALGALCGYFLNCWERERKQKQLLRDAEAGKYYELESLQRDLVSALAQIEQMTAVAERARIARDIHDNAGHEIVAAYMLFQTIRSMIDTDNWETGRLYDDALERLDKGVNKIREAVHNLSTLSCLGIDRLHVKCADFMAAKIDFNVYGDTTGIPIYVWSMLESCLNEALTNITRHSSATWVVVELDATPHIVRLSVANDGAGQKGKIPGYGLRNLRHRAAAIGGSISVDMGEEFRVVCVIPIRANHGEVDHEIADCRRR